jgi:restriction system protein
MAGFEVATEDVIPPLRKKRYEAARHALRNAESKWKTQKDRNDLERAAAANEYRQACSDWEDEKRRYEEAQAEAAETKRRLYVAKDVAALNEYWKMVSERSEYCKTFPRSHTFAYLPETHTLIVEYDLPAIDSIPKVQEVRYIESRKAFEEVYFPDTWLHDFYDQVIYRIAMRTIYALFQSDAADAVDSIVFNGHVRAIDRAIGHEVNPCILSVQTSKSEFMAINLSQVEPKAWFKRFKGVGSENLVNLEAVVPIRQSCGL